ncbi:TPA: site-specific DNA-methyltransferase [Escherichia coli]|uniref:DNA-methyltransferase n=1 Tax=Escherichia coli TaxID=562 RepID=UPI000BE619AE|nr:site-specific DNA-methyltransferase [Escherichia coli]EEQ3001293.1 site-specific DNA-methyltransferase [Escherichia coli]EFB1318248.1 site-specific DNA-methyltransferase [Escherichia coli]EFJ3290223.1 site-specific DNA-methyltransferase [Escherichia coli]EFM6800407.1 site-specific DNA-methyltransferase [Escherichia coli]EGO4630015.1 site-specific DNA-methyltransferase [Escherichia coli]
MADTVKISSCELINADCLEFIQTLPENSVDLIVTDPPYFKVKPEGWDNQWKGDDDYLKWLDQCLAQFWRVLKPAGSLYLFCGHRLASDIEIMMRERFNVLNHIIWAKPSGRWNGCNKESLRAYFPATERILFAEHYQGPYQPKNDGSAAKERELKQHVMAPLISYFRDARELLGITSKQIAEATGKKNMASHWFGASQWQLPNEADYRKLQALFARVAAEKHQRGELENPHHQLVSTYSELNRQYTELLSEYKNLRRYFGVTAQVPYTDVWTHKPVQYYPGKHPCEKPAEMLQQIINASSRPGDLVADFFMGSGSTVKAAMALGRCAIGVELETGRFEQTVREVQDLIV